MLLEHEQRPASTRASGRKGSAAKSPAGVNALRAAAAMCLIVVVAASCSVAQVKRVLASGRVGVENGSGSIDSRGIVKSDDGIERSRSGADADWHAVTFSIAPFAAFDDEQEQTNELLRSVLRARSEERPKYFVDEPATPSAEGVGPSPAEETVAPAASGSQTDTPPRPVYPAPIIRELTDGRVLVLHDGCAEILDPYEPFRAPRELPFVEAREPSPAPPVTSADATPLWIAGGSIAIALAGALALFMRRELRARAANVARLRAAEPQSEYLSGYRDGAHGTPRDEPMCERLAPFPGLFAIMYPRLVEVARARGYALTVHGSMARDLDVVAVPWTDRAAEPFVLAEALRDRVGGVGHNGWPLPRAKPHGRLAWSIHLGGGPYIDLSVVPPRSTATPACGPDESAADHDVAPEPGVQFTPDVCAPLAPKAVANVHTTALNDHARAWSDHDGAHSPTT